MAMTVLSIVKFSEFCVPAPQLGNIGCDRLGVLTGDAFDNAMYAGAIGKSRDLTRRSASLRGSSELVAKTRSAALLDLVLKTSPYVWEIRCHYPLMVRERASPLVVERMVTLERRVAPGEPHLHAVFCSGAELSTLRTRLDREGITSEVFDPSEVSPLAIHNASFSYGIARSMNILEPRTRNEAALFAQQLYESERRREGRVALPAYRRSALDRLIQRLAWRQCISFEHAYALFGVGLILGFICVPPDHRLDPMIPLRLAPALVRPR